MYRLSRGDTFPVLYPPFPLSLPEQYREQYHIKFLILVFLTIATGPHTMSDIDLESQVARPGPHAGAFFPLVIVTAEVVTARKEDVEGAEMHEM